MQTVQFASSSLCGYDEPICRQMTGEIAEASGRGKAAWLPVMPASALVRV